MTVVAFLAPWTVFPIRTLPPWMLVRTVWVATSFHGVELLAEWSSLKLKLLSPLDFVSARVAVDTGRTIPARWKVWTVLHRVSLPASARAPIGAVERLTGHLPTIATTGHCVQSTSQWNHN